MANIFVNGLNAKTGGGKSILNNYLTLLKSSSSSHKYYVLTPDKHNYQKYSNSFIEIIDISAVYKKAILFLWVNKFVLPQVIYKYDIDIIFNLADVPIPIRISQIFLFDWPYAVYPHSEVWKRMDLKSYITRKIKLKEFRNKLRYVDILIAQTETMKKRLTSIYKRNDIKVVHNAVSLENLSAREETKLKLPFGKKLLYLTYYYPHKNLEIFIPLAKTIKARNESFKIITTIAPEQHYKAKRFLEDVERFKLQSIIYNIGPVEMKDVPALYNECDALLMPTLLESFSGTYVEAMFHKIPILTSDIDFASSVCKDAAFYFDPLNCESIFKAINTCFSEEQLRIEKIQQGERLLRNLLNWEQAFEQYQFLINSMVSSHKM